MNDRTLTLAHARRLPPPQYTPVATSLAWIDSPPSLSSIGATAYSRAVVLDQHSVALDPQPAISYSSGTPAKATVDSATGFVTAVANGTSVITASYPSLTSITQTATISQVSTSVSIDQTSPAVAISSTITLTATSYDAYGHSLVSQPSKSWTSLNTGLATVGAATGVVTGVATGTPTIRVSDSVNTGTVVVTVSGTNPITSITLLWTSDVQTQMLLKVGTTYNLSAQDQLNNPLSNGSGAWASTDPTNCPVNSSGQVTPSALSNATITFTHTASGKVGTVKVTALGVSTPYWNDPMTYTTDASLRAAISTNVTTGFATPAPTGPYPNSRYTDGFNEGYITVDTVNRFMAHNTLRQRFPGGVATAPALNAAFPAGHTSQARFWYMTVKRYDAGFTDVGSGVGGAASYKDTVITWGNVSSGAGRITYTNGTQICLSADVVNNGSSEGGPVEVAVGNETTEWSTAKWLVDIVLYEARGVNWPAIRLWRFFVGDHPLTGFLIKSSVIQSPPIVPSFPVPTANGVGPFGANYNQTRNAGQDLYKNMGYTEASDELDPYHLLNDTTTPTTSGITGGTIAHGATNATIVLTGTNLSDNCWPVFSNLKIYPQTSPVIGGGGTTMTFTVNVDSSATTGAGTVLIRNGTSGHDSGTQVVTIT